MTPADDAVQLVNEMCANCASHAGSANARSSRRGFGLLFVLVRRSSAMGRLGPTLVVGRTTRHQESRKYAKAGRQPSAARCSRQNRCRLATEHRAGGNQQRTLDGSTVGWRPASYLLLRIVSE
ncbi:hypothetical protein ZHAS_00012120 [Anopheles sinensis]|uniref:Uncharacterized protein n=1 Tax=Anopheles sinensis TaxID=74873 RepID=A0A084W1Y3_ANOSI|nr:hypothetical protein ZHAS_00012120 [Anopheles sinensis]